MPMWAKILCSVLGLFLGGFVEYYRLHEGPGVLITSGYFWIGAIMSGLYPLGAYFVGLSQKSPWANGGPKP